MAGCDSFGPHPLVFFALFGSMDEGAVTGDAIREAGVFAVMFTLMNGAHRTLKARREEHPWLTALVFDALVFIMFSMFSTFGIVAEDGDLGERLRRSALVGLIVAVIHGCFNSYVSRDDRDSRTSIGGTRTPHI